MELRITRADVSTPGIAALVARHTQFCDGTAPAESCHRLPVSALAAPDITLWAAYHDKHLWGMGALKELSNTDGEIKSMHTAAEARGRGVANAILGTILTEAENRGYRTLWLETGSHAAFAPARRLYHAHGFTETAPFANYRPDPHSVFMTLAMPPTTFANDMV